MQARHAPYMSRGGPYAQQKHFQRVYKRRSQEQCYGSYFANSIRLAWRSQVLHRRNKIWHFNASTSFTFSSDATC